MLVFPGPPAPPSLPFLPLPSALQCCKAPHDSCRQKRTQGSCPGAALCRETVSALALGGAAWGSLGPCGVVSRVSAIESAVVARGGPAGSGTLNFFHPCWWLPSPPQEVPGTSQTRRQGPRRAWLGRLSHCRAYVPLCPSLPHSPSLPVRFRRGAPFASSVSPSLHPSRLERPR